MNKQNPLVQNQRITKKKDANANPIITEDWGNYYVSRVKFGDDFLLLMAEFEEFEENSDSEYNKAILLDAFKYDELYMLSVYETESMHKRNAYMDDVFCKDSYYVLPCFCIKQNSIVTMLWVHPRIKLLGIGKKMMQLLYNPIERHDSIAILPLPRKTCISIFVQYLKMGGSKNREIKE
jgi:hypothetical protein